MKLEINLPTKQTIGKLLSVFLIIILIFISGWFVGYAISPQYNQQQSFCSINDLNASETAKIVVLARQCEGLGLRSSVYWAKDAEGNVFGTPICLQNPN